MKVTVFGGSGFLGSHVADALTEAGHKVTLYDLKPYAYLRRNQRMVVGDIQNPKDVARAAQGADAVYNFAGIADIQEAHEDPIGTVRSNILGNCVVLEACVKARTKRYMFASTLYVYSRNGSFYAVSKQACEAYIENFQRHHGLGYTVLRYGSLYGSRTGEDNTVSRLIQQAVAQGRMTYHGDGDETREYIHVEDASRLSVEALGPEYLNQNLIVTGHQAIRVRELMEMINEILGGGIRMEFKKPRPSHALDTHYSRTPYSFTPRIGRKLIGRQYIDLGQGLLKLLDEIHALERIRGAGSKR